MIRSMKESDCQAFYEAFLAQGWHPNLANFQKYHREQELKERIVFVAQVEEQLAGYITLLPETKIGPFKGYPELVDFNVLMKYQKQGIGTKILDVAEEEAKKYSDMITLAVGLHSGYGAAQRLYVKRGYVPDGTGVWYKNKPLGEGESCCNDDGLVLYMSKKLLDSN